MEARASQDGMTPRLGLAASFTRMARASTASCGACRALDAQPFRRMARGAVSGPSTCLSLGTFLNHPRLVNTWVWRWRAERPCAPLTLGATVPTSSRRLMPPSGPRWARAKRMRGWCSIASPAATMRPRTQLSRGLRPTGQSAAGTTPTPAETLRVTQRRITWPVRRSSTTPSQRWSRGPS